MRVLKRILVALQALSGLAFLLLHAGPDVDTDTDIDNALGKATR